MTIVVDTSVIISVITNEEHKRDLVRITRGASLFAPPSLHWEIGNAFSAMFRRNRMTLHQASVALKAYTQIPLQFSDIALSSAIELAHRLNIYAYDAYFLACALKHSSPLLSLDQGLLDAAGKLGIEVLEVLS